MFTHTRMPNISLVGRSVSIDVSIRFSRRRFLGNVFKQFGKRINDNPYILAHAHFELGQQWFPIRFHENSFRNVLSWKTMVFRKCGRFNYWKLSSKQKLQGYIHILHRGNIQLLDLVKYFSKYSKQIFFKKGINRVF